MNSATFAFHSHFYIIKDLNSSDDDFRTLCYYFTSKYPSYTYLMDPDIKKDNCYNNNHVITHRDGVYCYITDEDILETGEEFPPTIILLNSLYGILVAFANMRHYKIPKVTITNNGNRYIISSENTEPIIIDPDLGIIYNETIPRIIMRRINNQWIPEYQSNNNIDGMYVWPELVDEELRLFYDLVIKDYNRLLLKNLYNWRSANESYDNQSIAINNILIRSSYNTVYLIPLIKEKQRLHLMPANLIIGVDMTLTKESLITFLEAWKSKLQYSDAFTLVFLGQTLRFFEGEPDHS